MKAAERARVRGFCSVLLARANIDEIEGILGQLPDGALGRLRDAILESPIRFRRALPNKQARKEALLDAVRS